MAGNGLALVQTRWGHDGPGWPWAGNGQVLVQTQGATKGLAQGLEIFFAFSSDWS